MKKIIPQIEPWLGKLEVLEVMDSIRSGWISGGLKLKEFQTKVAKLFKVKHAIGVCNGTQALYIALKVLGIGKGDEVIVPDFTFIATANAVVWVGAKPIFVDIDKGKFTIDPKDIEKNITKRTKAIIPVHLYGQPAEMNKIRRIAKKHNLCVVEDAAQALGVKYKSKPVGGIGDIGCLSFYADKVITTGEGGMVLTNNAELARSVRILINQGRDGRGWYVHDYIGYNFRMTDIQAGIGLAQLKRLKTIVRNKVQNYQFYRKCLPEQVKLHYFNSYRVVIETEHIEKLLSFLEDNGIQAKRSFYPLHLQPCYKRDGSFPNSVYIYEHVLTLPSGATLTKKDIKYVCDKIKEFYERRG